MFRFFRFFQLLKLVCSDARLRDLDFLFFDLLKFGDAAGEGREREKNEFDLFSWWQVMGNHQKFFDF